MMLKMIKITVGRCHNKMPKCMVAQLKAQNGNNEKQMKNRIQDDHQDRWVALV